MKDWREWGVVVGVGVVGILLVGYGLWQAVKPSEATVEIVREGSSNIEHSNIGELMVDVGGAVENPGVYSLSKEARIGEAIAKAGGLSADADRNWVSRYVNLASPVEDGGKLFIPPVADENGGTSNIEHSNIGGGGEIGLSEGKVNINTASVSELDSLWGIGEARAKQIVAGRPYSSIEELTSKAGIPSNVFEKIKEEISVY